MKYLAIILVIILALLGFTYGAKAATILFPTGGGTGNGTFTPGLLGASGTNPFYTQATTTVSCSGSTTCTSFTAIGGSPITISSSGGTGGSGTVGTSSAETATYIPFWTSTAGTPATLSGGVSGFAWDNANSRLTATFASTTGITATTIFTDLLRANTSAGTVVQASNGTPVSILGVGNSANALFYGGVNIDGATRLATSLTGFLKGTSGVVSSVSSLVPGDMSLTKGYLLVGNDAGVAQATSSILVSSTGKVGIGSTTPQNQLTIEGGDGTVHFGTTNGSYYSKLVNQVSSSYPFYFEINNYGRLFGIKDMSIAPAAVGYVSNYYGLAFATGAGDLDPDAADVRMFITQAGNVGVGTSTPAALLHVKGTIYSGDVGTQGTLRLYSSASSGTGGYGYIQANNSNPGQIDFIGGQGSAATTNRFAFGAPVVPQVDATYDLGISGTGWRSLWVSGTTNSYIGGNLGIGNTSPGAKLHVVGGGVVVNTAGGAGTSIGRHINLGSVTTPTDWRSYAGSTAAAIQMENSATEGFLLVATQGATVPRTQLITTGGYEIRVGATIGGSGTNALQILSSGNVGIGTTSPEAKLTVNGALSANGLITSYATGEAFRAIGATSPLSLRLKNTGNDVYFGTEGSSAGGFFTGSLAYSTVVYSNTAIQNIIGGVSRMIIDTSGNVGIGTTSPGTILSIGDTTNYINLSNTATSTFAFGIKSPSAYFTSWVLGLGNWDLSGATVKQHAYKSTTWPSGNATTTTATTTVPIGQAMVSSKYNFVTCRVTSGAGGIRFGDGTNWMEYQPASTTAGRYTKSTNNTFVVDENMVMEVGPLTAAQMTCGRDITENN